MSPTIPPCAMSTAGARARRAWRGLVFASLVLGSLPPAQARQPRPASEYYAVAQARERDARESMAQASSASDAVRKSLRAAIGAYRAVVLHHPTSGYCDNALWLGAQLASDAFARFGQDADRRTAIGLWNHLITEYPASPYLTKARDEVARAERLAHPDPVLVRDITRRATLEGVEVEVEMDGPVSFRQERLSGPPRLFFDLVNTRTTDALRDAVLTFDPGPVKQIRVGRQPNQTTRIVLDVEGVRACHSRVVADPSRLVIACLAGDVAQPASQAATAAPATTPATATMPVVAPAPSRPPPDPDALPLASTPPAAEVTVPERSPAALAEPQSPGLAATSAPPDAVVVATPPPAPPAPLPAAPLAPSSNVRGGFSIARQLGLRVGRIVIDPGHGGHDPGTMRSSLSEAQVTLDIALRLETLLKQASGVEVVLTRRTDVFVPLQERTDIANRESADLFVSIHVNAHRDKQTRGIETFLLNFASTPDAAAVAARENATSTLTMSHLDDVVRQIALGNKLDESRDLAGNVQSALVRRLRGANKGLRDLGVKQAPFVVLVGASMPSVLVEVAFLTHDQEGRLLATVAYRQRIAEALSDGVRRYLRALKKSPVVADLAIPKAAGQSR